MGHDDVQPAPDNEHPLELVDQRRQVVDVLEEMRRVDLRYSLVLQRAQNVERVANDVDSGAVQDVDADKVGTSLARSRTRGRA